VNELPLRAGVSRLYLNSDSQQKSRLAVDHCAAYVGPVNGMVRRRESRTVQSAGPGGIP
jgi:hypothetical protein